MAEKIDTTTIVVDPFNTDASKRWSWASLGKALLNAAENHAQARNFGMMALNGRHYTWVLSRLTIDMQQMPCIYDTVEVSTWIENIYRLFTNRNFAIRNGADGSVFGYARSVWAMIDYESRHPAQLERLEGAEFRPYLLPDEPCPIEPQSRMRPLTPDEFCRSYEAQYSDIDMNGHVNSFKYVDHIMDLFPIDAYRQGRNLQRLEIAYMAESYCADRLDFFRRQEADDTYLVEIQTGGKPVVRARLHFAS